MLGWEWLFPSNTKFNQGPESIVVVVVVGVAVPLCGADEIGEKSETELVRLEIVFSFVDAFWRSSLTRCDTRSRFCLSTSDIAGYDFRTQ